MAKKQIGIWMRYFLAVGCLTMIFPANVLGKGPVNTDDKGIAIKGYDTVAYLPREGL